MTLAEIRSICAKHSAVESCPTCPLWKPGRAEICGHLRVDAGHCLVMPAPSWWDLTSIEEALEGYGAGR